MLQLTRKITVSGETLELGWNLHAYGKVKELTGTEFSALDHENPQNIIAILYAAVDAAAALRDEPAPVSMRRLGALFCTAEDFKVAGDVLAELMTANAPEAANPPEAVTPNRSQRRAATRSARSTSESPRVSSGA